MADCRDNGNGPGCGILWLAIILLDTFGILMPYAGRYIPAMLVLGLIGFACGAVLGARVTIKTKQKPWLSSCRWAVYGFIGMYLSTLIIFAIMYLSS